MQLELIIPILAVILCIVGIIGCFAPVLPGPPLCFVGMLLMQWKFGSFEIYTLVIFALLSLIVVALDYFMPIWFAKKYGATKQGIWGSVIGMFLGMFFTPVGMILGLLLGAVIGDMIGGRNTTDATKSGIATFFGTIISLGTKLIVAGLISSFVIIESIKLLSKA